VREDRPGDRQLVAYYSTLHDESVDLHDRLRSMLPSYMVPNYCIAVREWPLTPSGKLDRRRLPAPQISPTKNTPAIVFPANDLEAELAAMFAQLLGSAQLSTSANFFDSGGHSLLAVRLQNRLRTTISADLSLRDIFDYPTVLQLARRIQELRRQKVASSSEPSPVHPTGTSADPQASWLTIYPHSQTAPTASQRSPLSYSQQRLWFLDQYEPGLAAYNIAFAWRLRGPLDVSAWQRAVSLVEQRHSSLRTNYQSYEGKPYQIVQSEPRIVLTIEDCSDGGRKKSAGDRDTNTRNLPRATGAARDENLAELLEAEVNRSFDLSRDSLMRLRLMHIGTDDHLLLIAWHHIATDGWSFPILWHD
ncbi:MAG: condensation domain-containing protein, partial [Planctomycetota bacterium]